MVRRFLLTGRNGRNNKGATTTPTSSSSLASPELALDLGGSDGRGLGEEPRSTAVAILEQGILVELSVGSSHLSLKSLAQRSLSEFEGWTVWSGGRSDQGSHAS